MDLSTIVYTTATLLLIKSILWYTICDFNVPFRTSSHLLPFYVS
jgi:hypothetical protein